MPRRNNYNYNFNLNSNKNKINMNPWAMLVVMLIITALNIYFTIVTKTLDVMAIIAFIACAFGIFMCVRNIIRSKREK